MHAQIQEYGYTLILDEVIEVIEPIPVSAADQKMLTETGKISVDEDGRVRWKDLLYKGRFEPLKRMANSKTLFCMEGRAYLWRMPVDMLRAFEEAYVLTFLFEGSHMKHYLDIHGIPYDLWHVEDAELTPGRQDLAKEKKKIRGLLEVYDGRLNALGEKPSALSKSWWQTNSRTGKIKVLEANTYNFLRYECKAESANSMWSVFSDMRRKCTPNGYAKGFCACNARATNEFRERENLAYLVNVYEHPYVVKWFSQHGVTVDQEAFALSQLLQWIWRSAIRDDKPVKLYLPSKRMRTILRDWLEEK